MVSEPVSVSAAALRSPSVLDSGLYFGLTPSICLGSAQNGTRQRSKTMMKITKEYLEILALLLEANVPLSAIDCSGLRAFFAKDKSHPNEVPHAKSLYLLITDIYGQYHHYFKAWFDAHPHQSVSLTFHEWHRATLSLPSIFVKAHYINDRYSQSELFVGLVEDGDLGLAGLLSNCPMIPNLGSRINTVTSNFCVGPKASLVLQHITGDPSFPETRLLPCIPKRLATILELCFTKIAISLQRQVEVKPDNFSFQDSNDLIPSLIINFLGVTYNSFLRIELDDLKPQSHPANLDIDMTHEPEELYKFLKNVFLRSTKARAYDYLTAVLFFQDQLKELARKQKVPISDFEWNAAEFTYSMSYTLHQVILGSGASTETGRCHPTAHMLLKWIKVCIARTSQIASKYPNLFAISVEEPLADLILELQNLHTSLELKQSLLIAGYLHPNTRKYLSPADLDIVKYHVNGSIGSSKTRKQDHSSNSLDDEILRMFNCSGSTKSECNLYDTHGLKEIQYDKGLPYLIAESGNHLLDFWRARHRKYPVLSMLARTHLSIQVNTDVSFKSAKLLDISGFAESDCSQVYGLRPLYFLRSLADHYHIRRFDPTISGAHIEDVERFQSDVRPDSGESSFYETSAVYPDE